MKTTARVVITFAMASVIFAVNKTGTTAAKFLSIGAGSKAVSMGGAFTSLADDASAMYWNPAGLARLKNSELLVNHTRWVADISYNYVGFAQPINSSSAFGINVTAVSMDEMDVTVVGVEEFTGETFDAGQFALAVTYAANLTDRFSIGINGKYISEYIMNEKATGFAIDLGTLFDTPYGFRLGTSVTNFGPKMNMTGKDLLMRIDIAPDIYGDNESVTAIINTDHFDLPLLLRVGISSDLNIADVGKLTWAVDANHPNDNSEYINAGLELAFLNNRAFLRAGSKAMMMDDREEEYTLGAGLVSPLRYGGNIQFDYAYELLTHLGDLHKFTLRLTF